VKVDLMEAFKPDVTAKNICPDVYPATFQRTFSGHCAEDRDYRALLYP